MSLPELIHNIGLQGGHRVRGRVLCDTWLYVSTDMRFSRGTLFTVYGKGTEYQDYEVIEVLATTSSYQKFRVAKLPPTL
ncbi:hypothetical protein SEA_DEJAVU_103 [Microbacterium Phage DejaVu]|nr:hypothetical protein SEA_DEJAVU_103 [Microbacterium Phage DejaVu]